MTVVSWPIVVSCVAPYECMTLLGLPFPENVQAIEEECGIQSLINISWEVGSHRYTQLLQ